MRTRIVTMADMMGDRAEFMKRRGPLSAITKSKIARALRGKRKPKSSLGGHVAKGLRRGALVGAGVAGLTAGAQALARRKDPGFTPQTEANLSNSLKGTAGGALYGGAIGAGIYGARKLKDKLTNKNKRRR